MADFAPNYTPRYRMRYSALGQVHTATIRLPRASVTVADDGQAAMSDLLNALSPKLAADFTVLGADVAGVDSDIFLPTAAIPTAPTPGGGAGDSSYRPLYASFVGRSTGGSRAVLFIYGWMVSPTGADNTANDWRVTSAEDADVLAAVAVLNGVTSTPAYAIDGTPTIWYPYANVGFNGYYQRKARKG